MTWSYVQGTGGTNFAVAYPSNVQSGSLLVVGLAGDRGTTTSPSTPTDTVGTSYASLGTGDDTTNGVFAQWWYGISSSAGANTVTFTNMLNFDAYIVGEWSVSAGTIALTGTAIGRVANHTSADDNIASNSISPSPGVGDVTVGLNVETGANVVVSAGSFFGKRAETALEGFPGNSVTFEDNILYGIAVPTATFTGDASGRSICFAAAFTVGGGSPQTSYYTRSRRIARR